MGSGWKRWLAEQYGVEHEKRGGRGTWKAAWEAVAAASWGTACAPWGWAAVHAPAPATGPHFGGDSCSTTTAWWTAVGPHARSAQPWIFSGGHPGRSGHQSAPSFTLEEPIPWYLQRAQSAAGAGVTVAKAVGFVVAVTRSHFALANDLQIPTAVDNSQPDMGLYDPECGTYPFGRLQHRCSTKTAPGREPLPAHWCNAVRCPLGGRRRILPHTHRSIPSSQLQPSRRRRLADTTLSSSPWLPTARCLFALFRATTYPYAAHDMRHHSCG